MVLLEVCKAKYYSLTKFTAKFEFLVLSLLVLPFEPLNQRAPKIENEHIIILKDICYKHS